jgi:hypothetical protein
VRYELELAPGARGPLTIEAALLWPSLGARSEAELLARETPEARRSRGMLGRVERAPEVLASAAREL